MIVTEPNGIGFALGGLAGNNAHGAGFLQAALDTGVTPEMISCTSGQLLWVWHYLRLLDNDNTVSGDGTLERRFQDELDKLSPLALIFDAVPTPWPSTEEFVRRAADLSRDWPFARDFTWWWLTLFGKKDRYQPCFPSLWLDIVRNAQQSTNDLLQKMLKGKLGDAFLVEFLANIAPNRVLKPDFSQEFFDNISATFNSSEIGIVFNSYQPAPGECTPGPVEYIHLNEVARKQLGRQYGTPASYRAHTKYARITPDAVRSALWLYLYGFDDADKRLDGAYYREMILSELCTPTIDRIFAVRPLNAEWKGPLPSTFPAGKDLETEVSFNGAYIGERDKIDLMNKVGSRDARHPRTPDQDRSPCPRPAARQAGQVSPDRRHRRGHRNAARLFRLRLRGHGHLPQGQGPGSKASQRRHGSHQPSPPTRPRTGAAPDIGQFQHNPMRPDRHWSRAAHVGQRAGQVPAPQLVFGAVGVVGARRRGVAVTGSAAC